MKKININDFIGWMENNKNQETGEYRIPRLNIIENGVRLKIREMKEIENIEECRYAAWWSASKEKKIYEKYMNVKEEEIPEEYIEFIKKMKEIIPQKNKFTIKEYLEWIKNNKYEITEIHKKPRSVIYKNGKRLEIEEMTESQKIEFKLGQRFNKELGERIIFEKYIYAKIEDVPKKYREMIKIIKSTSVFPMYIEWRKTHFNEETGKYEEPRMVITRNGIKIKPEDMTFEEKKEVEIAYLWRNNPEERRIIKKYEEKEIYEIPEIYREIIEEYRRIDGNVKYKDNDIDEEIARIKLCAQDYINRNSSKIEINREIKKIQTNTQSYINRRKQDEEER